MLLVNIHVVKADIFFETELFFIDDDLAELYLSLTRRILSSENALAPETRNTTIKYLFDHCVELLKHRTSCKYLGSSIRIYMHLY